MYPKVIIAIFFMIIVNANWSDCQTFACQQLSTKDGLPGSTVYSIKQDDDQVLWIATDGGICKYDGHTIEVLEDEQIEGEIIGLYHDTKGNVWMTNLARKIFYWKNGNLSRFLHDLEDFPVYEIYQDPAENFWFLHGDEVSVIRQEDTAEPASYQKFKGENLGSVKAITSVSDNHVVVFHRFGVSHIKDFQPATSPYRGDVPRGYFPLGIAREGDSILVISKNEIFSFDYTNNEMRKTLTQYEPYYEAGLNSIFFDDEKNLWVATRDGLLYFKEQEDGSIKFLHLLPGYAINDVFQDFERNFWVATQREGIFKLPSNTVEVYQNEKFGDKVAVVSSFASGKVIVGYHNNWLAVLDESYREVYQTKLSIREEEIYDLDTNEEGNEIFVVTNFGIFMLAENPFRLTEIVRGSGYKTMTVGRQEDFWIGDFASVARREKNGENTTILKKRTYAICLGKNEDLWVGTVEGLYKCNNQLCEKIDLAELEKDIRDIVLAADGTLWIATQSNGVYLYKDDKIQHHYSASNGLSGNNCQHISLDKKYAWVATNNGISKINLATNRIEIIREDEGLPSNDVKNLHIKNNKVYAATNDGLAVFDEAFPIFATTPNLFISNIQIENQDTTLHNFYELPHHQNDIRIEFKAVTFKNAKDVKYQYKLTGVNEDWVETSLGEVSYPALPYGTRDFFVKAKSLNSDWTAVEKITFDIRKAWWQTWRFYGFVALIAFLAGAKLFQLVIREIKNRNEIAKNLTASQLTALRAQMDPHFIFNAMNSIQDFIVQEDKRSANHYLSQFSKLMRNILNVSDKDKIPLKKEIDYLKLYLSLEALRFEEGFHYEFEVDDSLNVENTFIPSMLIQPFVENAIKHGLMHKEGQKNLWIRFIQKENYLLCEVEDNGIGREKSAMINARNKKVFRSRGMSLTKERIDLLNATNLNAMKLEIEDLKNKSMISDFILSSTTGKLRGNKGMAL
ncbi:MAG: histidine kinase, partial [Bacteroidota bacterium]